MLCPSPPPPAHGTLRLTSSKGPGGPAQLSFVITCSVCLWFSPSLYLCPYLSLSLSLFLFSPSLYRHSPRVWKAMHASGFILFHPWPCVVHARSLLQKGTSASLLFISKRPSGMRSHALRQEAYSKDRKSKRTSTHMAQMAAISCYSVHKAPHLGWPKRVPRPAGGKNAKCVLWHVASRDGEPLS